MVSFRRFVVGLLCLLAACSPAGSQIIGDGLIGGGLANFPLLADGTTPADVDLLCQSNTAFFQGATGPITSFVTSPRATSPTANQASINDSLGNYRLVTDGVFRISDLGCLTEEARTNSIPNNSGQPLSGTPTGWVVNNADGLTITASGFGTENGIDYTDLLVSGTASASNNALNIAFTNRTTIAALYGQTWDGTLFPRLSAGSLNGAQVTLQLGEQNAGGVFQNGSNTAIQASLGATTIGNNRQVVKRTLTQPVTAFVQLLVFFTYTNATTYNFTIRVGWPQLERDLNAGAVTNSPLPTINTGGTGFTPSTTGTATWAGSGCNPNPVLAVASDAGGNLSVTGVNNGGLCGIGGAAFGLPPNTVSTWTYTGVGAGAATTFNLTPLSASATSYPTSPIRTTAAAITRSEDGPIGTVSGAGNAFTFYLSTTIFGMINSPLNSFGAPLDLAGNVNTDTSGPGTSNAGGGTTIGCGNLVGNVGQGGVANVAYTISTPFKFACALSVAAGGAQSINGGAFTTGAVTGAPAVTTLGIGRHIHFQTPANEFTKRAAWWLNYRATNSGVQSLSANTVP